MATALAVSRRAEQVAAAPGRPRSDQAHQAVLKATRELLLKHPSDEVRIEHIAARAGVGKATIYRHWPTRDALVQELLLELAGTYLTIACNGVSLEEMVADACNSILALIHTDLGAALLGEP